VFGVVCSVVKTATGNLVGNQHFKVTKQSHAERTTTQLQKFQGKSRVKELAEMLGASGEQSIQTAKEILASVEKFTGTIQA